MSACALGLDLGTSSAKAVVIDTGGTVLSQASAGYPVTSVLAGYAESEPAHWWNAVTACTREAVQAAGALRAYQLLGSAALARLANPLAPGMAGPLLVWIAENEPRTYTDARWALQPKDWLRARLTGEFYAEPSDASATLLYDLTGDRWDLAAVSALGLDDSLLASLLPSSGAPAGSLTPGAAAAFHAERYARFRHTVAALADHEEGAA